MYIRTKTRTNKSKNTYTYAYLAVIKQRKSHPKQKIVKYLGRVYKFYKKSNNLPVIAPESSFQDSLREIIKTELINHDFNEISPDKLKNNDIEINLDQTTIINAKTNKKACIEMNQGLMCEETLKKLLYYKPPKDNMQKVSKHFAKTAIEAGIPISDDIINVFKKIQAMINNPQQSQTMPNNQKRI